MLLSAVMLLSGCNGGTSDDAAPYADAETSSAEPTAALSSGLNLPYSDSAVTHVDSSAVDTEIQYREGDSAVLSSKPRFPDYITVGETVIGDDGYTHFHITDSKTGYQLSFAILTDLPDMLPEIIGGEYDAGFGLAINFKFSSLAVSSANSRDTSRYGLWLMTSNYADITGPSYQDFVIIEDDRQGVQIRGYNIISTSGAYTLISTSPMNGMADTIMASTDVSQEEKDALRKLLDLPQLVILE